MTDHDAVSKINAAWQEEGSIGRLGLRPFADKVIQQALIPGGGDWQCVALKGCITRSIVWNGTEVALMNPSGDLGDATEGGIAMGMRATPVMDKALRAIFILAKSADNLDLIGKIARAATDYVEQPAPRIEEPEEEEPPEEVGEEETAEAPLERQDPTLTCPEVGGCPRPDHCRAINFCDLPF